MLLNDFLGFGTVKAQIKIISLDTNKIIFEGLNKDFDNLKENNLKLSCFKNEQNCIYIYVYEKR